MNPSDIGKAYDQITHLWTRDAFDRANGVAAHRKALQFVTTHRGVALDVGCGCTGRFAELLIGEGFQVEGVDVSEKMISISRKKYPDITFHCADICQWQLPTRYDFITAWDSIWHVPLERQKNVIEKLVNGLNPGGVLIFSFGGTATSDEHTNHHMGVEMYYATLGTEGVLAVLLKLDCLVRHLEYEQHPEKHAFVVVEKR